MMTIKQIFILDRCMCFESVWWVVHFILSKNICNSFAECGKFVNLSTNKLTLVRLKSTISKLISMVDICLQTKVMLSFVKPHKLIGEIS